MWMILRKHLHCQTTKASAERERTKSYNRLTCGVTWNIKAENFKRLLRINRFTLYFSRWECKWSTAGPGGACLWAWCACQWSQASQGWGLRVCLHSEMLPQRQKWGESKGQSMLPFYWENCQKKQTKMAGYILADVGDLSQFKASLDYIINSRPARALSQRKTF